MAIPRFPEKFTSMPFFNPADFLSYMRKMGLLPDSPAPRAVILGYQKSLFDYIVANHKTRRAEGYFGQHLRFLADSETAGDIAVAGGFGIGAPATAVMLEELIAWGVREFISMGTAGSLRPEIQPGSLVLCDRAFIDEGTSYHYIAGETSILPDPGLTARLSGALQRSGLDFHTGPTWTTDAIYRETPVEVINYRDMGALVVEMEASALFSVARFRSVPIACCFSVSDTLAELAWRPEFHSETTREGLEKLFRAALDALG
jgi:uridine phosphorylase